MNIIYVVSILYLIVLFLLYKKNNNEICFWSSIIYVIGVLFCYNTLIVYLVDLLGINGSIILYSIINYFIGTFLLCLIFIRKKGIQKYYFDKKKLFVILGVGIVIFLVGCFRFRGFEAISYESGDSSVHYRHALEFSEELAILDENNSKDHVFKQFVRVMPISYINCGLLFNVLSGAKTYTVFSVYNVLCLVLIALIFLITVIDIFKYNKKDYFYAFILTLFYTLAFPLNGLIMGFCYLNLSIMVINLLYLTIFNFKDDFDKNIIFKIIIILLLTFSCFYSYYLFVPAIYLSLGIYYIVLWRKKQITFKQMFIYGMLTLIIPFSLGFYYFFITLFRESGVGVVGEYINMWGYSYGNITPVYLFVGVSAYFIYSIKKKKEEFNFLKLNISTISLYILIFLVLCLLKKSELYYFYKLFSLYWLFVVLFLAPIIKNYARKFYVFLGIFLMLNIFVYDSYMTSSFARFIVSTNIYSWNTATLINKRLTYNENELEILEESKKYLDICKQDNRFLMVGKAEKNVWYYSITDTIPVVHDVKDDWTRLNIRNSLSFKNWDENLSDFDCLIYYYESGKLDINKVKYDVLYENEDGIIIKKKD